MVGVYCVVGGVVVGGVGQEGEVVWWQYVEQVWFVWVLFDVGVVDCYGYDLCVCGFGGCMGLVQIFEFFGVGQQVGGIGFVGDDQ